MAQTGRGAPTAAGGELASHQFPNALNPASSSSEWTSRSALKVKPSQVTVITGGEQRDGGRSGSRVCLQLSETPSSAVSLRKVLMSGAADAVKSCWHLSPDSGNDDENLPGPLTAGLGLCFPLSSYMCWMIRKTLTEQLPLLCLKTGEQELKCIYRVRFDQSCRF